MFCIGLSVGDEILTYEEVVRLQPEERLKRPIVLIGEYSLIGYTS